MTGSTFRESIPKDGTGVLLSLLHLKSYLIAEVEVQWSYYSPNFVRNAHNDHNRGFRHDFVITHFEFRMVHLG